MDELTKEQLRQAFADYDKRKAIFSTTHKAAKCSECGRVIHPGSEIWCEPMGDRIYCSPECCAYGLGGAYLEFDDDDYDTWFERRDCESD
jgi:hypothetical protein